MRIEKVIKYHLDNTIKVVKNQHFGGTKNGNHEKYIATFWRGNPQMKNGGYETTREIEAVSITSARKKARDIEDGCAYGSMSLLSIEKEG